MLVDTGMMELYLAMADMDPRLQPLSEQDFDLSSIDIVTSTHTGTPTTAAATISSAGKPIYVQRRKLDDARSEDDDTIREWVEVPGVQYLPVDGEHEPLPRLRLVPAPGHTRGMQMVVIETGEARHRRRRRGGVVRRARRAAHQSRQRVLALDPELSGSRTSTSPGDSAPSKASRRRWKSAKMASPSSSTAEQPPSRRAGWPRT